MRRGAFCSSARKVRLALFEERTHAFAMILGLEQLAETDADPGTELVPIGIQSPAESLFQLPYREGRVRRDLARQLLCRRQQLIVRYDARNEMKLQRAIRVDDVAREQQLSGGFASHELCQASDPRYVAA